METRDNQPGNGTARGNNRSAQAIKQAAIGTADEAKARVRSMAEERKEQVSERIDQFARALRGTSDKLREDGEGEEIGRYAEVLGEQAEKVATFLREHDTTDLVREVEGFAKRQPLVFMGGCAIAGFAIGRFLKATMSAASESLGEGEQDQTGGSQWSGASEPEPWSNE